MRKPTKQEMDREYDLYANDIDPMAEWSFRADDLDSFSCEDVIYMSGNIGMSIEEMITLGYLVQDDGEWYLDDSPINIIDWQNVEVRY